MKRRALLSVSDKTKIVSLAKGLVDLNFEIISTGGTKKILDENKIPNVSVSDITNFKEILDGRIKTLHPNIHAPLLARRDERKDLDQLQKLKIELIDLVVVNLYPFKNTVLKDGITIEEAIENIDIGGPTMLRSAAKNYKYVTVVCDVKDYDLVLEEIKKNQNTSIDTRKKLAIKVFEHTAYYDAVIVEYFKNVENDEKQLPDVFVQSFEKVYDLRYGENPHQKAALYKKYNAKCNFWRKEQIIQGKEMSYNNIQDSETALRILNEFSFNQAVCVVIKHCNPCAVVKANNNLDSWNKVIVSDPVSIFGGIVAFNKKVEYNLALKMKEVFLEVIIAPDFSTEALEVFSSKKNLRIIKFDCYASNLEKDITVKSLVGGVLIQEMDNVEFDINTVTCVTQKKPSKF